MSTPSRELRSLLMVAMDHRPGAAHPLDGPPGQEGRFAHMSALRMGDGALAFPLQWWSFAEHDVRQANDDVCFYLEGGDGLYGRRHRSLDFRIPCAMIAEALARAGQPHAPLP